MAQTQVFTIHGHTLLFTAHDTKISIYRTWHKHQYLI